MSNQPKFGEWINCSERLPEEDLEVLVFGKVLNDPPRVLGVRRRYQGDQAWKHEWEAEDGYIFTQDEVTHWMVLPEVPRE